MSEKNTPTQVNLQNDGQPVRKRIKSFVLRSGRMTELQKKAYAEQWQKYGLSPKQAITHDTFTKAQPLVLEIGFGMGDSLVQMAEEAPDKNFIGIEVHRPGVGKILNLIAEKQLTNLRVYEHDAIEVLSHCIADESLERVQVYFPDPWHKKKHHKRRLIQPMFLDLLIKKTKPKGVLHMATDWEHYAQHMMSVVSADARWENIAGEQQYSPRPDWRPITKFEKRGHRLGHGTWDLLFEKIT